VNRSPSAPLGPPVPLRGPEDDEREGGRLDDAPGPLCYPAPMNIKIVVHEAAEGGFWGEAPALPGCASQGETLEELMANMREAIEGWMAAV